MLLRRKKIASCQSSHSGLSKPLFEAAKLALLDRTRSDLLQYNSDADVDYRLVTI
jgi:hypothetical protein